MNFSMIPEKIKQAIPTQLHGTEPDMVLRSSSDSNGESGESYFILFNQLLYIFSKKIGNSDYDAINIKLADNNAESTVEKENYKTIFKIFIPNASYIFHFSGFDEKDVLKLASQMTGMATEPDSNPIELPVEETNECCNTWENTMEILAAALMYLSLSDNEIAHCEDNFIIKVTDNNKAVLQNALKYFKTHNYEEFLQDANILNKEQQLCILANLMELGFADGVLHKSEQNMIKQFCEFFNIEPANHETIQQVIYLKNNTSIFS